MSNFIMMCGLAGSGKSTFAKHLLEENPKSVIVSSDSIREELYGSESEQGNPTDVFNEMRVRTLKLLKEGHDVIYDATNINRKRRKGFLKQLPRDIHKVIIYIATPYKNVLSNNNSRERVVPQDVIHNMYKNLHVPIKSEGWDEIILYPHDSITDLPDQVKMSIRGGVLCKDYKNHDDIFLPLSSFFNQFSDILNLSQDSSFHSFSVSRHTFYVYKYIFKNQADVFPEISGEDMELLIWVGLLHDLGKRFCKSFVNRKGEETRYANFIGHENVSAQLAVEVLSELGFTQEFILRATTLIQFHMYLLNESNNREKLIGYVGQKNYEYLQFIRDADNSAH